MSEAITTIKKAESDANKLIEDTEAKSSEMIQEAKSKSKETIEKAKEEANSDAEKITTPTMPQPSPAMSASETWSPNKTTPMRRNRLAL